MHRVARSHRPLRPTTSLVATIAIVAASVALSAPGAAAVANTCRARNVTKGTVAQADLQRVINAASSGDTLSVKNVCVGNFTIGKRLTLVGKPTEATPKPALHAGGAGRTLLVNARATLTGLTITGGSLTGTKWGAGIRVTTEGILTLLDTVVRGNTAEDIGGIWVQGALTLKGTSSVRGNVSTSNGGVGGIFVDNLADLTLKGTASVRDNAGAGITTYYSTVVFDGSSTVSGNDWWGVHLQFSVLTMNGSASVVGNTFAGIGARLSSWVVMNDQTSVTGNDGGGVYAHEGDLTMNGTSSVSGNSTDTNGGGVYADFGTVTLNDDASVTGNTADADDTAGGIGGGIFVGCDGTLLGAEDGGNVDENHRGTASPVEDNISFAPCG